METSVIVAKVLVSNYVDLNRAGLKKSQEVQVIMTRFDGKVDKCEILKSWSGLSD